MISFSFTWTWDLSSWLTTEIPVGIWKTLTALLVLLTCWPPAPLARKTSSRMSDMFNSTETVNFGRIQTLTVLVWTLPLESFMGTLWTRCMPLSCLMKGIAWLPNIIDELYINFASTLYPLTPIHSSTTSVTVHIFDKTFLYRPLNSLAKMAASSPPTP